MASDGVVVRKEPQFAHALLAGAAAGLTVDLMFFPLDTLKTRMQSSQGFLASGGLNGIYKGIGSVFVGSAPGAAAFFTMYENLKTQIPHYIPSASAPVVHMLAASGGEFTSCLIRVPTEVVKSRAQVEAYGATSAGSLKSAKAVFRTEGVKGFYRGFGMTISREIPFTSIQFPLYEFLKKRLGIYLGRAPRPYEASVCGMIAGGTAASLTTPLDVVKTRVMLELKATGKTSISQSQSFLSIPHRLLAIAQTEGPAALFSGVVPRTIWISLGGAAFLGVYEAGITTLQNVS